MARLSKRGLIIAIEGIRDLVKYSEESDLPFAVIERIEANLEKVAMEFGTSIDDIVEEEDCAQDLLSQRRRP